MASRDSGLYGIKNREASERRRPSLHYVDLSGLMVFTKEELDKEIMRIPEQKLRPDDEMILNRTISIKRLPSLTPSNDPLLLSQGNGSEYAGSLDRKRRRSSALSAVSSSCSRPTSPAVGLKSFGSFFELSKALSKVDDGHQMDPFPYPDPVPPQLRHLDMKDLVSTDIDWKMLTMARPASKVEEDFFSRLVECARLQEKAKIAEGYVFRQAISRMSRHSRIYNRYTHLDLSSELEQLNLKPEYDYDAYARTEPDPGELNKQATANANELVAKLLGDDTFASDSAAGNDESGSSDRNFDRAADRRKPSKITTDTSLNQATQRLSTSETKPKDPQVNVRVGKRTPAAPFTAESSKPGSFQSQKTPASRQQELKKSRRELNQSDKNKIRERGQPGDGRRKNAEHVQTPTKKMAKRRAAGEEAVIAMSDNKFASGLLEVVKPDAPMIVVTTAVLTETIDGDMLKE